MATKRRCWYCDTDHRKGSTGLQELGTLDSRRVWRCLNCECPQTFSLLGQGQVITLANYIMGPGVVWPFPTAEALFTDGEMATRTRGVRYMVFAAEEALRWGGWTNIPPSYWS